MSAPIQSSFLENLLGSVNNTSFALPYPTSGSGSGGFLAGLDFSSILGGGSSASGAGGALGGLGSLASLFGPIGAGLGVVSNLIPGLDGFLQNGFAFSCLGSQAFNKGDMDALLNELKRRGEAVKGGTLDQMCGFMDYVLDNIHICDLEIGKYRSTCSKNLRSKLKESYQQVYDSVSKESMRLEPVIRTDWEGIQYSSFTHREIKGGGIPNIALENVTPEMFESQIKPEAIKYALANNLNPTEVLSQVEKKLFPNGVGGSGGVVLNEDGTIDWSVQAGNTNKPDYVKISLIALAVLVAYKFLIKK